MFIGDLENYEKFYKKMIIVTDKFDNSNDLKGEDVPEIDLK